LIPAALTLARLTFILAAAALIGLTELIALILLVTGLPLAPRGAVAIALALLIGLVAGLALVALALAALALTAPALAALVLTALILTALILTVATLILISLLSHGVSFWASWPHRSLANMVLVSPNSPIAN
jgi:hypothetical protein